jgi:hypothetical protein
MVNITGKHLERGRKVIRKNMGITTNARESHPRKAREDIIAKAVAAADTGIMIFRDQEPIMANAGATAISTMVSMAKGTTKAAVAAVSDTTPGWDYNAILYPAKRLLPGWKSI